MISVKKKRGGGCRLTMEGELNIYAASTLRDELAGHVDACKSLEVDLSGVSELDTAGFQILLAAKRDCIEAGKDMRLVSHSPAVLDVLGLFGMERFFGDPLVLTADAENGGEANE